MKNVKYAQCVKCGKIYEAIPSLTNCSCGGILDIIYDYDYIRAHFTRETLAQRRDNSMWRYRELLPVEEGTPNTPLRGRRSSPAPPPATPPPPWRGTPPPRVSRPTSSSPAVPPRGRWPS